MHSRDGKHPLLIRLPAPEHQAPHVAASVFRAGRPTKPHPRKRDSGALSEGAGVTHRLCHSFSDAKCRLFLCTWPTSLQEVEPKSMSLASECELSEGWGQGPLDTALVDILSDTPHPQPPEVFGLFQQPLWCCTARPRQSGRAGRQPSCICKAGKPRTCRDRG